MVKQDVCFISSSDVS